MKFSGKIALVALCIIAMHIALVSAQPVNTNNITSPTKVNLNSVYIVSNLTAPTGPTNLTNYDAWAVGDNGTIIRWNGTGWMNVTSPTTANLYNVIMTNSSSGWAVGGSANNGTILRYNGTWSVWNRISTPSAANATNATTTTINATLYSVTTDVNGTAGWIVGSNGAILRWNGTYWTQMPNMTSPTRTLRSVSMIHNSNDSWAAGDNGTILRITASSATNMTTNTTVNLYALSMLNATSGWAMGGNTTNGVVLNLNGTTWMNWNRINFGGAANATDKLNATMYSISLTSQSFGWAVGANGTVLYWDGIQWSGAILNVTRADLRGVSMVHGATDGVDVAWAVGDDGTIIAWNGTQWIPELPIVMITPILAAMAIIAVFITKTKLGKKVNLHNV